MRAPRKTLYINLTKNAKGNSRTYRIFGIAIPCQEHHFWRSRFSSKSPERPNWCCWFLSVRNTCHGPFRHLIVVCKYDFNSCCFVCYYVIKSECEDRPHSATAFGSMLVGPVSKRSAYFGLKWKILDCCWLFFAWRGRTVRNLKIAPHHMVRREPCFCILQ